MNTIVRTRGRGFSRFGGGSRRGGDNEVVTIDRGAGIIAGLLIMSFGFGAVFVAVTTARPTPACPAKAGLAAALINTSTRVGGALGLAILSAIAASRTHHLLPALPSVSGIRIRPCIRREPPGL